MKNKVIDTVVDILCIMVVFSVTDWVMQNVVHSEKMLPEILVYLCMYGIIFGAKWGIVQLWKKLRNSSPEEKN